MVFCIKFSTYLIDSKSVNIEKRPRQCSNEVLTGLRVSKTGRAYLYASRTYGEIFKHVGRRLDASKPYDWCFDGPKRFPDQPKCNWLDRWSGKATGPVPQF